MLYRTDLLLALFMHQQNSAGNRDAVGHQIGEYQLGNINALSREHVRQLVDTVQQCPCNGRNNKGIALNGKRHKH